MGQRNEKSKYTKQYLPLEVVVEKVCVKQSLQNTTKVYNPMVTVILLGISPVNPIQNVKSSIGSHKEYIIPGQVFYLPITLQDDQLRQNSNCFQINRKGPQQLYKIETGDSRTKQMRHERNNCTGCHRKLPMQKGILGFIVGRLDRFLETNRIDNGCRRGDVHHFHY